MGYPKSPIGYIQIGAELKVVVVQIYAAVKNVDDMEGRGPNVDHAYYHTEKEATVGARGINGMLGDGTVEPRTALRVHGADQFFLVDPKEITVVTPEEAAHQRADLREQVLKKLTRAEIIAFFGEDQKS